MPFYHFEVRTQTHVMTTEGGDFPNNDAARVEAAKRVGHLLHDHAGQIWADQDWQMDITDEMGLILYVIRILASRVDPTRNLKV